MLRVPRANLNRALLDLTGYDLALRMRWRLARARSTVALSRIGWISPDGASWGNCTPLRAILRGLGVEFAQPSVTDMDGIVLYSESS